MTASEPERNEVIVAPAFLSLMAHELAQPLAAALGATYTLKDYIASDELDARARDYLYDTTIRNLEQLQSLLDSLRVFSEAEAGRLSVETVPVSVKEIFRDAEGDFGTPRSQTHLTFTSEPGLQAEVELMLFRQVLTNLIGNAAKFSPEGSLISVDASKTDGDMVLFTVSDEGTVFRRKNPSGSSGNRCGSSPARKASVSDCS